MAIDLNLSLVDAYSRTGSKRWNGTDTTIADAGASATALIADFEAVSDMGVVKETLSQDVIVGDAAVAGANVDAGATIHCRLDNGKQYALKIPAFKASLVNPDGSVKIDDAAVTGFVANFESGGKYRVSDGNYVTAILYGELDR